MDRLKKGRGDRVWRLGIPGLVAALSFLSPGCREEKTHPEWVQVSADLKVEIARTPEERQKGLMFRQHLPGDQGMYFIFENEEPLSFYMRDTRIPLSIAFIGGDGIIESIADMIPLDERSVPSSGPAQFALEVNKGWFDENRIRPGDKVVLDGERILFFRNVSR